MNYDEFLGKLSTAIEQNKGVVTNGECETVDLTPVNEENIEYNFTKDVNFDSNGNWSFHISEYCPFNIDVTAHIETREVGVYYDVRIDTNFPEHKAFGGIVPGQEISTRIRTNTFSSTSITVSVHSSKPNTQGRFLLRCSI